MVRVGVGEEMQCRYREQARVGRREFVDAYRVRGDERIVGSSRGHFFEIKNACRELRTIYYLSAAATKRGIVVVVATQELVFARTETVGDHRQMTQQLPGLVSASNIQSLTLDSAPSTC